MLSPAKDVARCPLQLVDLTGIVIEINALNRAAITFRAIPPLRSGQIAA